MKALALERAPAMARPSAAAAAPAVLLAQRHSTFGGGSIAAPPIIDSGRPLAPAARHDMEQGFGRDFGAIRVHDDARAHDNARALGALAYAAGDHIVFGEGQYAPETPSGRALLAHELAHTVQQSGVQMKADGPLPAAADSRLEAEADSAARAVTGGRPVPGLSRISAPAVFRQTASVTPDASAAVPTGTPAAAPAQEYDVPEVGKVKIEDDMPTAGAGATWSRVSMPQLDVPNKGTGDWVKAAYGAAATGGSLLYRGTVSGGKFKVITDPEPGYGDIWIKKYGFKSLKEIGAAITTLAATKPLKSPNADKILAGFAKDSFATAGVDVDHIVEKQLQGSNIASNLQMLSKSVNRSAGSRLRPKLAELANNVRTHARPKLKEVVLSFPIVKVEDAPTVTDDLMAASCEIETLMRSPDIKGNAAISAVADGSPVGLLAGGKSVVANIRPTGPTDIPSPVNLLVTGMRLETYTRVKTGIDTVLAEPTIPGIRARTKVTLQATKAAAPGPVAVVGAEPGKETVPAAVDKGAPPGEYRKLTIPQGAPKALSANFPFMSPVTFKTLEIKDDGLHGTGTITPTGGIIPPVDIIFTPTSLKAVANITKDKLKTPAKDFFRFTGGELALQLTPFVPSGKLEFNAGPAAKPIIKGFVEASYKDGAFIAIGQLEPAGTIPGIDKAQGTITYHSINGWSGALTAQSGAILGSTVTAELGFREGKGGFEAYGKGGFSTTIRGVPLNLSLSWNGTSLKYSGKVTIPKPMPLVKSVDLEGSYGDDGMRLTGTAPITWKGIEATMNVTYRHKAGAPEGQFSGSANIKFPEGKKVGGSLDLNFDEHGNFGGKGTISYQLTPKIRPTLSAEYKKGKLKMSGEVAIGDIPLTKEWPKPGGEQRPIIKGLGFKFQVPTPVMGVTAYGEIKGSLGVAYGIGPVMMKGVKLNGSLYPLEDDPQPEVKLTGTFAVPGYGEIYGTFGAYIGVDFLLGAAGAKGGIEITPSLRLTGEGGINFEASYAEGGFSFSADAYAKGKLVAKVKVNLAAKIYLLGDIGPSWDWTYPLGSTEKRIGPEMTITLGKVAYKPDGTITWPSLDQIDFNPKDIDPFAVVEELMKEGKESKL